MFKNVKTARLLITFTNVNGQKSVAFFSGPAIRTLPRALKVGAGALAIAGFEAARHVAKNYGETKRKLAELETEKRAAKKAERAAKRQAREEAKAQEEKVIVTALPAGNEGRATS